MYVSYIAFDFRHILKNYYSMYPHSIYVSLERGERGVGVLELRTWSVRRTRTYTVTHCLPAACLLSHRSAAEKQIWAAGRVLLRVTRGQVRQPTTCKLSVLATSYFLFFHPAYSTPIREWREIFLLQFQRRVQIPKFFSLSPSREERCLFAELYVPLYSL